MARTTLISQYMTAELPVVSKQKRLPFRPTQSQAQSLYRSINKYIFDNQLTMPDIVLKGNLRKCWGACNWELSRQKSASHGKRGTWCTIELMDKWFCPQWFCTTLAHEMVHQYQWDYYRWDHWEEFGREVNLTSAAHGPSFFAWRPIVAEFGIDLKTSHGMKRWFKHQDFRKC